MSDQKQNGIFKRVSTRETIIMLNGSVIGACSLTLPEQIQQEWLTSALLKMEADDAAKVLLGTA